MRRPQITAGTLNMSQLVLHLVNHDATFDVAAGLTSQSGSSRGSAEGETVEIGRSSRVHDSAATTRRGGNAEHSQGQQDGGRKLGAELP